jgi:hypothetical protein
MGQDDSGAVLSKSAFADAFSTLRPAILGEWSQLDEAALAATAGDLDKVVLLVAERTAHTKALVRRQLEELYRVVTTPLPEVHTAASGAGHASAQTRPRRPRPAAEAEGQGQGQGQGPNLDHLIEEFERRTSHIIRELRGGFLGGARDRVRDNVFFSLLVTLGLGFIVGVLFTGGGRGK